ncbi:hypothetical protein SB847_09225 [Bacillus sp. SIMBA_026]|uniref:hypothetical protein n=1 Tax=Bacillus sp. SIMBA_026 TaxID=3085769 RepID=UPI0039799E2D
MKFSDIELEMFRDEFKKIIPFHLQTVAESSKLIVAYYQEFKKNPNVEPGDVLPLAVCSAMKQLGFDI